MSAYKFVLPVLASLGVLSASAEANGGRLDAPSITKLFPGQFEARVRGYQIQIVARGDGGLSGRAFGRIDQGQWFLQNDRLCVAWRRWTEGKAKCGVVSLYGEWLVASNEDGPVLKFRPAYFGSLDSEPDEVSTR